MTRFDIAIAATELYEQQGYERTTVEQIAHRAGVSMRTFYRYCVNKDEAITSELTPGPQLLAVSVRARAELPIVDAVVTGFVDAATAGSRNRTELKRTLRLIINTPALRSAWLIAGRDAQDDLVQVVSQRCPTLSTVQARALTAALTATLTVAIETWAVSETGELADYARDALGVMASALTDAEIVQGTAAPE
ncbi:TetR family transcriptional regulator [Kineococcus sp. R86509]|uniref:TetR/AcrR family transcriptional regulator n=1 Tax=Kineococcus sp. R86509 TaxID=3093851 RepID=UPI0036D3E6D5